MLTIPIQFDDLLKVVEQLTPEQKRILRENLEGQNNGQRETPSEEAPLKPRILGLHEGMMWTSDDFDDSMPMPPDAQASGYRERR